MPRTLKITPAETVTVLRSEPGLLEVEVSYAAGGSRPPKYWHPEQDEHFEVIEGTLRARVNGDERELRAGETIEISRGVVHQMWNPGAEPTRVLWQTTPAGRTEKWFGAIDALHREGRVGRNGMPGPLAFSVLLTEYRDVFRLGVRPDWLVRGGLALMAVLGRARGY